MGENKLSIVGLAVLLLLALYTLQAYLFKTFQTEHETVVEESRLLRMRLESAQADLRKSFSQSIQESENIVSTIDSESYYERLQFADDRLRFAFRLLLEPLPDITEVSFIAADPPSQVRVYRNKKGEVESSRVILFEGKFLEIGTGIESPNPTADPGYRSIIRPESQGKLVWDTPEDSLRLQKAIHHYGTLLGVVSVGSSPEPQNGTEYVLCNREGKAMVTSSTDPIFAAALKKFANSEKSGKLLTEFEVDRKRYSALFKPLPNGLDLWVGVVLTK